MTGETSDRRASRRAGAAREEFVELALAAGRTGTYEWDLATGALTWDRRTFEIFGYDPATVTPDMGAFWARVHPDDALHVRQRLEEAIRTCGEFDDEYRLVLPEGERWIAARGRAVGSADEPGRAAVVIGAIHDTTEQRVRDTQVARVLETMPTGFYYVDRDWRFAYVNGPACRLLGAARDELLGQVVWDRFPATAGTAFEDAVRRAKDTGLPVAFEAHYPEPLDAWYEVHAWPAQDGLAVYFVEATEQHRARDRAERAAAAATLVSRMAAVIAHDEDAAVPGALVDLAVPALGGDWAVVALLDGAGPGARVAHGAGRHRDPARQAAVDRLVAARASADVGGGRFIRTAIRSGHVVVLDSGADRAPEAHADSPDGRAVITELAPDACMIVPVMAGRRPFATITVFYDRGPVPSAALAVAEEVLRRGRVVVENALLSRRQRSLVELVQRSLLATPAPLPGVELAVRYLPASTAARVGGDWYDAFALPDGDALLVIGDVVGHDVEAAAAMGQVRSLLRGVAAATGLDPAALLDRVDDALGTLGVPALVTTALVRLAGTEPGDGRRLTWSAAGHPPPLVLPPGGPASYLPGETNLLLGYVRPPVARREHTARLAPGSVLLLYTDGLVERRDRSLRAGLDALRAAVEPLRDLPLDELCDAVLERMVGDHGPADDVALLAARVLPG